MKIKYLSTLIIALFGLLMVSCSDRLNIAENGNRGGVDKFYSTDNEADEALASLYISLRSNYFDWFFVKNMLSDDSWTGGGSRGDNSQLEGLNEYTFSTDNSMIGGLYSALYTNIYKANLIIDKVPGNSSERQRDIAEARYWRAFCNFELVTLWGTPPLIDHLLSTKEYRPSNSTPAKLWAAVDTDLKTAISSNALPSKTSVNDSITGQRITKEAAEALLGKSYLFQGKYSEAASMLDKVIESDKYCLYTGDYSTLLHAVNNNCCESIVELQMRNDTEQEWNQMTMLYLMIGWRTDHLNISGDAATNIATGTYGFMNPTKSLYNAFVSDEGINGYRLKNTIRTYAQMNDYGVTLQSGISLYGNEGYFNWKNRCLKSDCITDASYFQALQYIDLHFMRYAEVLLMAAEANLETGNTTKALKYTNLIRNRAKLSSLSTITLSDIKLEKRLELCFEGIRYQDLIRWNDASTALANQGAQIPCYFSTGVSYDYSNSNYGFKEKNKLLPIPLKEIELNSNISQNANW